MNLLPGFQSQDDAQCRDPKCEYQPKLHGVSHLPTTFVLLVGGPGFTAQFKISASYIDSEALGAVFAELHATVWRDWCRLNRQVAT